MKREIVNLCLEHRHPHEECPPNCGHAISYFARIEKVQRIIARELLEERKAAEKLEKAAIKAIIPVYECQFCHESFQGHGRKFCSKRCREHALNKRLREQPKFGWIPKVRECLKCGAEFLALQAATRLCSKQCHAGAERKQKGECIECGSPVGFHRKHFCGDRCSRKNKNRRKADKKKKPKVVHAACHYCKKQTNHEKKYCGKQCERRAERDRKNARKSPPQPPKVFRNSCVICSSDFDTIYPSKKFCCKKCKMADFQKKKRAREKGKKKPPQRRIKDRLSGRLRELLRRKGQQKQNAIGKYMGCTPKEMLAHVNKQLEGTKMNWSNYGVFGWHLDHIIPCRYFDLCNEEHVAVCFNWRNIRPLWGKDNQERRDNVSLLDALEIPPELFEMATKLGVKLWL